MGLFRLTLEVEIVSEPLVEQHSHGQAGLRREIDAGMELRTQLGLFCHEALQS